MHNQNVLIDDSTNPKQVILSSKCSNGACIGIELDEAGNKRIVNVKEGVTKTGFSVTDDELRAFIAGAAQGDFSHLLRESLSKD